MYIETNINHRIIREFWNSFAKKGFNHIDYIDKVADRNSYTDKELNEIDFSLTISNIEFPCNDRHLPHGFYYEIVDKKYKLLKEFENLENEIFNKGKYDSLLIEINKYAFEQRMYTRQFTSTEAFIKLREFENFGEIYQFSLKKFQKEIGKDYTEIDFLKDDIAFCKKELETQESIDIINLFKRRIRVFENRIAELNSIKNDKLIIPITEINFTSIEIELLTKLMIVSYFNEEVKIQLFTSGNENYKEQAHLDLIDIRESIKENKNLKNTWRTNSLLIERIYEANEDELEKLYKSKFKEISEIKNFKTYKAFAIYELNDFKSRYEKYFGTFPIAKQWCDYLELQIKNSIIFSKENNIEIEKSKDNTFYYFDYYFAKHNELLLLKQHYLFEYKSPTVEYFLSIQEKEKEVANIAIHFEKEIRNNIIELHSDKMQLYIIQIQDKLNSIYEYLENKPKNPELKFLNFHATIPNIQNLIQNKSTQYTSTIVETKPIFKPEMIDQIFVLLKDFFSSEHQVQLNEILRSGGNAKEKLIFLDNGNRLADTFKQLIISDIIIGCQKKELENWICVNFKYLNRQRTKDFTAKYINDIISTNKDKCQNPILNVTKNKLTGLYELSKA